jgi:hypothetical protein
LEFCRKKPNSKEPTAKRAKVGKGKNVNESNAENEVCFLLGFYELCLVLFD